MAQLVKESTCNVEDLGSIPGLRSSPGEGTGYPLQYPGLENSMDSTKPDDNYLEKYIKKIYIYTDKNPNSHSLLGFKKKN